MGGDGGRRPDRGLRRRQRRPGAHRHDRDLGAPGGRRRLRGRDRRRRLERRRGRGGVRGLQRRDRPGGRRGRPPGGHPAHGRASTATPASCRRAGSWWWARRRAASRSPTSCMRRGRPVTHRRRRARADAAPLPRRRHPLVDGRRRRPRRALRRDRRPGARAQPPVDAAGRLAGRRPARPERPHRARRAPGRPAGRGARRAGPVLRVAARTSARWPTSSWPGCSTRIDAWAAEAGLDAAAPPERLRPTAVPSPPALELDLGSGEIRTIVWATGYRPELAWLELPVLDPRGPAASTTAA